MRRSSGAAVVLVAVVGLLAAAGCGGNAEATTRPDAATVRLVVQLVRHEERGVVIANQAAAQSLDPAVRAAASRSADAQRARAELLDGVLDGWAVPDEDRRALDQVDTPTAAESAAVASCTLVKDPDAVSRLANSPVDAFDAEYRQLVRTQLRSGRRLADELTATGALSTPAERRLADLSDELRSAAA